MLHLVLQLTSSINTLSVRTLFLISMHCWLTVFNSLSSAMEGLDFQPSQQLVATFDGSSTVSDCSYINVTILEDLRLEEDEVLTVNLLGTVPAAPAVLLTRASTSVIISDNDRESCGVSSPP